MVLLHADCEELLNKVRGAGICNTGVTSAISREVACFTTVQTKETINSTTKDTVIWRQEGMVT